MSRSETQGYYTECKREEAGSTKCAEAPEKRQIIGLATEFWRRSIRQFMSTKVYRVNDQSKLEALREPRNTTKAYHLKSKKSTKPHKKGMLHSLLSIRQVVTGPSSDK